MDFTIKQGDTHTVMKCTLYNPSGSLVDLTSASAQLIISDRNVRLLAKTATIQNATSGVIWVSFGDTDLQNISGWVNGEIQVTFPDGKKETYPNNSYLKINVVKNL